MSENSEKSLHAISILKEAHQLCQDGKFDEAVQKCEAAMQVYQDDDNQVGILCCYVNISNVHRSKAARYFKEQFKAMTEEEERKAKKKADRQRRRAQQKEKAAPSPNGFFDGLARLDELVKQAEREEHDRLSVM